MHAVGLLNLDFELHPLSLLWHLLWQVESKKFDQFLSHKISDAKDVVLTWYNALAALGHKPFLDRLSLDAVDNIPQYADDLQRSVLMRACGRAGARAAGVGAWGRADVRADMRATQLWKASASVWPRLQVCRAIGDTCHRGDIQLVAVLLVCGRALQCGGAPR